MRKVKIVAPSLPKRKTKAAESIEENENQMISLAMERVRQRIIDGTASSQELVHFLRLGSTRERLEREILEKQKEQIEAKTDNLKSSAHSEELYSKALAAMSRYSGNRGDEEDYDSYIQ